MISIKSRTLCLFIALFCASGSSVFAAGLPAVSDTSGSQRLGTFVWFDLLTYDRGLTRTYYQGLFGWEVEEANGFQGYDLITNQGQRIGGIAEIEEKEQPTWLGSFSVNDVGDTVDRVTQLGGHVLEPAQEIENRGVMALVEDNAGAMFVLLDTGSRDPGLRPVRIGDWLWVDLFTRSRSEAAEFYQALAGLQLNTVTDKNGNEIDVFMQGETARSGVVEIPWRHVDPIWLPYVRVDNVVQTIERSDQLGGQLFYRYEDGAILLDPTGAAFGVHQVSK